MPKTSIIIPTYSNSSGPSGVRACLQSIVDHTDLSDVELIVVANGAPPESRSLDRDFPCRLLWFDEPIGYTKAMNEGIRIATGDFIVPLNDDCVILGPGWLDILMAPFIDGTQWNVDAARVGLTGPMMEWDSNSNHKFLIFFCVMIRRAVFDSIGLLDEAFNPGFGEDTDFCIKAERAGWHVIMVPDDTHHTIAERGDATTLPEWKQSKIWVAEFPIWHDGEQTFQDWPGGAELLARNRAILAERYGAPMVNIERAKATDGWIAEDELQWLGEQAKTHRLICEIGSWHGRSSRALADNLMPDGQLYCCDTWNGTSGEPEFHATAAQREGDHAHQWWWCNLHNEIVAGKVIPLRMHSVNAAEVLASQGVQFDMIFIDADHSYEGVKADILAWTPLLKDGGLLCGHDYYNEGESFAWVGVKQCVDEMVPGVQKVATSIWWATKPPHKPQVYDTFLFYNELDVLDIRFAELYDVVDRFIVVEGILTHSGKPKPLNFDANKDRYAKYLHKVTYIVVDDYPALPDPGDDLQAKADNAWSRERWQRDAIMRGLTGCRDDDVILIGDADEIARAETVRAYDPAQGLCRLKQRLFYYKLNCENKAGWDWLKIAPYKTVKELTPCGVRYPPAGDVPMIESGGWHFSFLTPDADGIAEKIRAFAHVEYSTPEMLDTNRIAQLVAEGKDVFGRDDRYEFVEIDESYPPYVREHTDELKGLIMSKPQLPEGLLYNGDEICRVVAPAITVEISTKDRYTTTLPMCIASVLTQTHKPERLVIYDDGEQKDLRELSPFSNLLAMATDAGIQWEVFATPRQGQVANHQHALDNAKTPLILRIDDDVVMEPNVIEELLKALGDDVGAVAPLIHHPGNVRPLPETVDGSLKDVGAGLNLQWYAWNGSVRETEHLYSSFLYRVEAARAAGGYPKGLSRIGHHEETLFTHAIMKAGWRVRVTPYAKMWHLREATGGIRDGKREMWEHDEQVFQERLKKWGTELKPRKVIVLDCGLGDHFAFKSVLPQIRAKHPDLTLAVCYEEVFEGTGVPMISIADAKLMLGDDLSNYSAYKWAWDREWKRPMSEAFLEMNL
jgi:beta-1,4-mannosyl-glycoprotein beta-1,4-N-acetylglucosaminyltransferase